MPGAGALWRRRTRAFRQELIDKRQAACKEAGKNCEAVPVFPDAPHGFNADYRPSYPP